MTSFPTMSTAKFFGAGGGQFVQISVGGEPIILASVPKEGWPSSLIAPWLTSLA
jgi:hypothetical protein